MIIIRKERSQKQQFSEDAAATEIKTKGKEGRTIWQAREKHIKKGGNLCLWQKNIM